jgi:hypothetical protein
MTDSSQFDFTGYTPLTNNNNLAPTPSKDLQPGRSSTMRCPLPILGAATADALRSFYLKGNVPQVRLLTPEGATASGGTTTTTAAASTASSGSSGSTTTIVAKTSTITTAVLSPGQIYTGVMSFSRSFQLLVLATTTASRVRLYGTSAAQMGDLSRGLDIPPAAGTGQNIICDVVLDTLPQTWSFQSRVGANADTPQTTNVYVNITNLGSTSTATTVTFQYVPLQA